MESNHRPKLFRLVLYHLATRTSQTTIGTSPASIDVQSATQTPAIAIVLTSILMLDAARYTYAHEPSPEFVGFYKRVKSAKRDGLRARLLVHSCVFATIIILPQIFSLLELSYVTMYDLSVILSVIIAFSLIKTVRNIIKRSKSHILDSQQLGQYFGSSVFLITIWFILIRPIINLTLTWLTISVMIVSSLATATQSAISNPTSAGIIIMAAIGMFIASIKLLITFVQIYFLSTFAKSLGTIFA